MPHRPFTKGSSKNRLLVVIDEGRIIHPLPERLHADPTISVAVASRVCRDRLLPIFLGYALHCYELVVPIRAVAFGVARRLGLGGDRRGDSHEHEPCESEDYLTF